MQRGILRVCEQANLQTTTSGRKIASSCAAMQSFYLLLPTKRLQVRTEGRRVCMDEMMIAYYVAYTVFLCLSSIQVIVDWVNGWHEHIRSSRQKRNKRK